MSENVSTLLTLQAEATPLRRQRVLTAPAATLMSTLYAAVVVLFPWGLVQRMGFSDFADYVNEFNSQWISKRELYQLSGLKQFYSFEVLWDELVRWLTRITGDASVSLRLISFFILFVWGMFLFRRAPFGIALLFLFNPTAIDVAMSGIRNGLAWALVIAGLSSKSKAIRFTLFFIALFIHSSTLALLTIYGLTYVAGKFWKPKALASFGVAIGILLGLAVTVGTQLIASFLNDRRLGAGYVVGGGSLLQASMWGILLYLQFSGSDEYVKRNVFVISVLAWYETMNPFIPWSYRIWGALLPVIAVSLLDLPLHKRQLALYTYAGYLTLQWIYWTKLLNYWHWT